MRTTSAAACTTTCLQKTSSTARDAPRGRVSGRGLAHDADHSDGRADTRGAFEHARAHPRDA